ncbi:MAG: hypothetical protein P4L56_04980 [Candidatus Sulfopaludibacter sp.]|nr:hypothetical protein [Candidatus Sulfopaludibacter sp.]
MCYFFLLLGAAFFAAGLAAAFLAGAFFATAFLVGAFLVAISPFDNTWRNKSIYLSNVSA